MATIEAWSADTFTALAEGTGAIYPMGVWNGSGSSLRWCSGCGGTFAPVPGKPRNTTA